MFLYSLTLFWKVNNFLAGSNILLCNFIYLGIFLWPRNISKCQYFCVVSHALRKRNPYSVLASSLEYFSARNVQHIPTGTQSQFGIFWRDWGKAFDEPFFVLVEILCLDTALGTAFMGNKKLQTLVLIKCRFCAKLICEINYNLIKVRGSKEALGSSLSLRDSTPN